MSNIKYDNIWRLLKENQFKTPFENNNNLKCILCNKILINAHNGPCGCRYCHECITNYLGGDSKFCPGNSEDCSEELLNINGNVMMDQTANNNVSKIKVKCPQQSCGFIDNLNSIENHVRVCKNGNLNCPYFKIGCNEIRQSEYDIDQHLTDDNLFHIKLFMDLVDNWKNDIKSTKQMSHKKKTLLDDLLVLNSQQSNEIAELKNVVEDCKRQMQEVRQEMIDCKSDCLQCRITISDLREHDLNSRGDIENLKQESHLLHTKFTTVVKTNTIDQQIEILDSQIIGLKNTINTMENNLALMNYGEYVWNIDKFSEKNKLAQSGLNPEIHSDPFYSHKNGYKMCLCVYPNGGGAGLGTHFSLGFALMKGEFDDILEWPMKHQVTFSIINQISGVEHKTAVGNYWSTPINNRSVFNKPDSEKNLCLSRPKFIPLGELLHNDALVKKDTIVLRCSVSITDDV